MNVEKSIKKLCPVILCLWLVLFPFLENRWGKELLGMTKHDQCPYNLTSFYQLKLKSIY